MDQPEVSAQTAGCKTWTYQVLDVEETELDGNSDGVRRIHDRSRGGVVILKQLLK